uniref:Uncharacterized protein n=1 Tax=Romanomermis culicivorax TaxID=13658 RepID=A0A915K881_ROMCU
MGVKRKALGNDKPKPDKHQCMGAKSPDMIGAKEAKTNAKIKAKMEAEPEAKARRDIIEEGLNEAIEAMDSILIVWSEGLKAQARHLLTSSTGRTYTDPATILYNKSVEFWWFSGLWTMRQNNSQYNEWKWKGILPKQSVEVKESATVAEYRRSSPIATDCRRQKS